MQIRYPAEWEKQQAIFIGFPHDMVEWGARMVPAQAEIIDFANMLASDPANGKIVLVCRNNRNMRMARAQLADEVETIECSYGDIWFRDTGPLAVIGMKGKPEARCFRFNGWGGKYQMAGDRQVSKTLAREFSMPARRCPWVLEGGSIECDGQGLLATTEQCLLNPNRNPELGRKEITSRLRHNLGINQILWLGDGLVNDHTDGHIDNLARFVAPGVLAIAEASGGDDPNADIYADALARAKDFGVEIVTIPSPGRVVERRRLQPASHMNFVISNRHVIVPVYDTPYEDAALKKIESLFPGRSVVPLKARATLFGGGGAFHCASIHVPAGE